MKEVCEGQKQIPFALELETGKWCVYPHDQCPEVELLSRPFAELFFRSPGLGHWQVLALVQVFVLPASATLVLWRISDLEFRQNDLSSYATPN